MNNTKKGIEKQRLEARLKLAKELGVDYDSVYDKLTLAGFTTLPLNDPFEGRPR